MKEHLLERTQIIPASREKVFAFFSDPRNLEMITPPWLHFKILTHPLPQGAGSIFDYTLRVRGIPIRWRTLIEEFVPDDFFIDRQIRGPYQLWHHTHTFKSLPDGSTEMKDRVRYVIGWGILGTLAHYFWVQNDLRAIFDYRYRIIENYFKDQASSAAKK